MTTSDKDRTAALQLSKEEIDFQIRHLQKKIAEENAVLNDLENQLALASSIEKSLVAEDQQRARLLPLETNSEKKPNEPGYKYARLEQEPTKEDVIKYLNEHKTKGETKEDQSKSEGVKHSFEKAREISKLHIPHYIGTFETDSVYRPNVILAMQEYAEWYASQFKSVDQSKESDYERGYSDGRNGLYNSDLERKLTEANAEIERLKAKASFEAGDQSKESQEELWNEVVALLDMTTYQTRAVEMLKDKFTITRKKDSQGNLAIEQTK